MYGRLPTQDGPRRAPMIEPKNTADTIKNVVVHETGRGRFQQEVVWGVYHLIADEPTDLGGLGSGFGPYELLLASLGACTAMTLRLYADQKHWPLKGAQVRLRHSRIHAEDCAECETKSGMLDRIDRVIALQGDLTHDPPSR